MTEDATNELSTPLPAPPRGGLETLLGLSGVGFLAMVLCLYGYWAYGEKITAGLDQACAEAAFQAGQQFEASGNYGQAVVRYRQAMEGRFDNDELRHMCGRAIGDLLFRQERFAEAVAAYEALPPEAFEKSGAYTGFVTALWRSGALDRAKALGSVWLSEAEGEKDEEQEIWARNVLMHIARTTGNSGEALGHGRRILELAPGNDAAVTVAQVLQARGELAEARAVVETMLKNTESPSHREAGRNLLEQLAREASQAGQS